MVPWNDPTTPDIKASASALALALPKMTPFILNPTATFRQHTSNTRIDVGMWTVGAETLVVATNMNYAAASITLGDLSLPNTGIIARQVFDSGAKITKGVIQLDSVGSGAFVVNK